MLLSKLFSSNCMNVNIKTEGSRVEKQEKKEHTV